MAEPTRGPRCPQCGLPIPLDRPEGLCDACLLVVGATPLGPETRDSSSWWPPTASDVVRDNHPRLAIGQNFGPYRIHRLLGRGGMGEVYEAEHLGHGRRIALKVLNERLRRTDDRARFIQEGQLAASVNHPHVVYIFGSEEIVDVPAITMELLPGGTLKDRVKTRGPLPPSEAVDAILHVIAGLAAAHRAGILHRDVKPSNCFIDRDGTIKVGDFGLSIPSLPRGIPWPTDAGAFQGTPEFAAPEQLRGEELDVRADIYAVAATLFYLLTGRPPFETGNDSTRSLIDRVATDPPPSARRLHRGIPRELDRLLTRCLAKSPATRVSSYPELTRAVEGFRTGPTTNASLAERAGAALLDAACLIPVQGLLLPMAILWYGPARPTACLAWAIFWLPMVYWTIGEGFWGRTLGMRVCWLRVLTLAGVVPGPVRALGRSLIALVPIMLVLGLIANEHQIAQAHVSFGGLVVSTFLGALAILFAMARGDNALMGIHDWLTDTRVVRQQRSKFRPTAPAQANPPLATPTRYPRPSLARIGAYDLNEPLGPTGTGELFLGFDRRLKRRVWVHAVHDAAPLVSTATRDARGAARLHWLGGQRMAFGGWDAYEAPDGQPFVATTMPQPWSVVRGWLLDLASEFQLGLEREAIGPLTLEHIWIAGSGAKILDFRAPGRPATRTPATGTPDSELPATLASAQRLLHDVTTRALGGPTLPRLPLTVWSLLERLSQGGFASMAEVVAVLTANATQPDRVTRMRRVTVLAVTVLAATLGFAFLRNLATLFAVRITGEGETIGLLLALAWAVTWRSGFWLRTFGLAVVTADGREASRARAATRALVAWSWVPIQVLATVQGWAVFSVIFGWVKVLGVLWTAVDPTRGPHDRVAGTYLVPR